MENLEPVKEYHIWSIDQNGDLQKLSLMAESHQEGLKIIKSSHPNLFIRIRYLIKFFQKEMDVLAKELMYDYPKLSYEHYISYCEQTISVVVFKNPKMISKSKLFNEIRCRCYVQNMIYKYRDI